MGLGQRLHEIRHPKNPQSHEKFITGDTYKQFDTMGVVEKCLLMAQCAINWVAFNLNKLRHIIKSREFVFYFPQYCSEETDIHCHTCQ